MKKSTKSPDPLTSKTDGSARATSDGTHRLADRFSARFAADFYRDTSFGASISSIGLGTYLGESTDEDDAAYVAAARYAIANGINLIDTAINYRGQRSERALCTAIQAAIRSGEVARDELVVCTKGGYIPLDGATPATREEYQAYVDRAFIKSEIMQPTDIVSGGHSLAPRFLRYCVAKSRQNLGLRSIDVYYVHNPEQQLGTVSADELYVRLEAAFIVLEEAADRGEISVYGVATWDGLRTAPSEAGHLSLEQVVMAARRAGGAEHHLRVVQLPVNLAMSEGVRAPTQVVDGRALTVVQAASQLGLTVVGSASLMQGRLASGLPPALREHFPTLRTDAQRALAFARTIDGLGTSLVGMKSVTHVEENLEAGRV